MNSGPLRGRGRVRGRVCVDVCVCVVAQGECINSSCLLQPGFVYSGPERESSIHLISTILIAGQLPPASVRQVLAASQVNTCTCT